MLLSEKFSSSHFTESYKQIFEDNMAFNASLEIKVNSYLFDTLKYLGNESLNLYLLCFIYFVTFCIQCCYLVIINIDLYDILLYKYITLNKVT